MTEAEIVCRQAGRNDLPAIIELYAQPDMDDGRVLCLEDAEAIFERMNRYPDYRLFVAESGMAIVGSYALLVMDNLGHCGARSAVVEDVVVDPAWQGHGVGKQMMAHAMTIAGERGCYKLVLSSNVKRESAHAFYRSLGFEQHGYSFRTLAPASAFWG